MHFHSTFKGIDPQSIRGTKTGVYIGCSVADAAEAFGSDAETLLGYSVTGTNRAMLANRLSYSFDFRGNCHTCSNKPIVTFEFRGNYVILVVINL